MMIHARPADSAGFSANSRGAPAPLPAEVAETQNGEYELTPARPVPPMKKT